MAKWDGLNRRRFPRVNFPCLVLLHQKNPDSTETVLCHTENVGIGGLCVILKQHVKLFSQVDIELDLMDMKDHVKCKGKIVWNIRRKNDEHNKPLFNDIGIEYIDLTPGDQARIEAAVVRLAKQKKDKDHFV